MSKIHFVAIGGNLPGTDGSPALAVCHQAATDLAGLPGIASVCRSRWFSTAPVPPSEQPRFINGVIRFNTVLTPAEVLLACQAIEARAGRKPGLANAARTLDLDIIDMDGLVRVAPDPILPHPRMHLRAFVLLPLRDVAPAWIHPALGVGLQALIAALPPQDVRPV